MANLYSSEVTELNKGIQAKTVYRGNVQVIPVTIAAAEASKTYEISATLPQGASLIGLNIDIETNSGNVSFGTMGGGVAADADSILGNQDASSADKRAQFPAIAQGVGSIDVGNKVLTATTDSSVSGSDKSISGYILIATQE